MQGSRAVARIITIVLALVMAPAGTVLLSWGGTAWYRYYVMQATVGLRLSDLAGPMGGGGRSSAGSAWDCCWPWRSRPASPAAPVSSPWDCWAWSAW